MPVSLRLATEADVPALAALKRCVWPVEDADPARIASALADEAHSALLAVHEQTVVGLLDGFVTRSASETSRWEVDLLAVHPAYRGRGLGARLLLASARVARQRGATSVRGLVQLANVASQRTFARCAYQCQQTLCTLYVSSRRASWPQAARVIAVNTFNYAGLWLEGALKAAPICLPDGAWELAGAVIPADHAEDCRILETLDFAIIGQYQWWVKTLQASE